MYCPALHSVTAVHSRSFLPYSGLFDSHSPSAHSSDVLHTMLWVMLGAVTMCSLKLQVVFWRLHELKVWLPPD